MLRKLLCILAAVAFVGLPLSVGCAEDEIKHVEEKRTTHEGEVRDVSPGDTVVE